jgi:flagellar L-ring protein precursor FlgH
MAGGLAAQSARGQAASALAPGSSGSPLTGAASADAIAAQMSRNGGSLYLATMAAPRGPEAASSGAVSFFAVPEPLPRTLKKHDLVTVVVRENSAFSSQGSSDLSKTSDYDTKLNDFITAHLSKLKIEGVNPSTPPELNLQNSRDFTGSATVDRTDTLTAQITAEIIDVKPNGTLTLQGLKTIKTDDEVQQFVLTGVCRAEDVGADNTILSTQLYNLELQKNHMGTVHDTTQRGFIPKLIDTINPF